MFNGRVINKNGVVDSAKETIAKTIGNKKHLIYEIKAVIDDLGSRKAGA